MHPGTDRARMFALSVPARHLIAIARCPDNIWITGFRDGESGFAAAHAMVPADLLSIVLFAARNAWSAHVPVVLHVAVEVVGNLIVDGDVVHLPDWEFHVVKATSVNSRNVHSSVVSKHEV